MSPDYPLDVLVGSRDQRRPSDLVAPHVWTSGLPRGSVYKLNEDVYICSPEFVYVQMATQLDEVELAQLANELCGSYALNSITGFSERTPLTTKAKLQDYVNRSANAYGARKARHALRWVANGSASPQETIVLLVMCLPVRLGGFGLPIPALNKQITVSGRLRAYVTGNLYRPDFLWEISVEGERVQVAAEYDSTEWHNEAQDAERTRIRRNDFQAAKILTTSINKSVLKDAELLAIPLRQISRDLQRYPRAETLSQTMKRQALLDKLLREDVR